MAKLRKKPVVIEAEQFFPGKPAKGVCECSAEMSCHVHTIHNNQSVCVVSGDWIIPEKDGIHFYPCKPDIFAATYEPVLEIAEYDPTTKTATLEKKT